MILISICIRFKEGALRILSRSFLLMTVLFLGLQGIFAMDDQEKERGLVLYTNSFADSEREIKQLGARVRPSAP